MSSLYLIRVVERDSGETVVSSWTPGSVVEKDLIEELVQRVRDKGVGVLRTEAHVIEDVRSALRELLLDLKKRV